MPTYEAECTKCDHGFEYEAPMAKCHLVPRCPVCSAKANKVLSNQAVQPDLDGRPYYNQQLKMMVKSVDHAIEIGKRRGHDFIR